MFRMAPILAVIALLPCAFAQDKAQSAVFKRIFGIDRTLPADMVEKVKALNPGESIKNDTDGDGRIDEMWYIDSSPRHNIQPMLVRVVDEDGDMHEMGRGDLDSDVYYWDHHADGFIDVVTDYQDDDGDNDLDQMGIFYDKDWKDGKDDLTVWWSIDIGDDNMLWYDVNGNYYQPLCQWRTHFSGDEVFYQFRLVEGEDRWLNMWEDPFAFYDPDGDRNSELVVRISAVGNDVQNLRYSIDVDNNAEGRHTHDYDFSITAIPGEGGISAEGHGDLTVMIRGIESAPVLSWAATKPFSKAAPWAKALLTWDELGSNTDQDPDQDPNERWEGILNQASKHEDFPQVGGPPSAKLNKRIEVSLNPASPLSLYFDAVDQRFHLPNAAYGYYDVDFNLDGEIDAAYTYEDTNNDGILDLRKADVNNDGVVDIEWPLAGVSQSFDLEFEAMAAFYPNVLTTVLSDNQAFIDAALQALDAPPARVNEILAFFNGPLKEYHPEREIGDHIRSTPAGLRYFSDLLRDTLYVALHDAHQGQSAWSEVAAAFTAGHVAEAATAVAKLMNADQAGREIGHPFMAGDVPLTKRVALHLGNHGPFRESWPVVVKVADLKAQAPDFNPANCAVVAADRWVDWREIPHQVDAYIFGEEQLSFVTDLPAQSDASFYVFYVPEGERKTDFPKLTNAVLENPAYVAWESEYGAFRFYTGQFDFFGKMVDQMKPRAERLIYPLVDVNYHAEQPWGIDALHVGKTSGLGGLTLYVNDEPHLVQSPAGEGQVAFQHRVIGTGPVRSVVEIQARNVIADHPDQVVTMLGVVYAHRQESEIIVQLPVALASGDLAPGLMKLEEDRPFAATAEGCIGTWGYQGDDIGEIGLGVIVPSDAFKKVIDMEGERRMLCKTDGGRFNYWIIGEWRRGMQYAVAPTVDNWRWSLTRLAAELNAPIAVALGN